MRPAHEIVIDALEVGLDVKLGEHKWVFLHEEDGTPLLCVKAWNETKQQPTYINPDLTFNSFIKLCSKLTQEELMVLGANTVLNEGRRKQR